MRTSILNTFAKSINLSLIAAPDSYPHFEQGIKDYIYPILSEIQETQIPERLTLISINTIDHEEQGFHFTIKDPDTLTPEESLEISNQVFPFDPEASLEMPLIHIWSTLVMVTVPFTC